MVAVLTQYTSVKDERTEKRRIYDTLRRRRPAKKSATEWTTRFYGADLWTVLASLERKEKDILWHSVMIADIPASLTTRERCATTLLCADVVIATPTIVADWTVINSSAWNETFWY